MHQEINYLQEVPAHVLAVVREKSDEFVKIIVALSLEGYNVISFFARNNEYFFQHFFQGRPKQKLRFVYLHIDTIEDFEWAHNIMGILNTVFPSISMIAGGNWASDNFSYLLDNYSLDCVIVENIVNPLLNLLKKSSNFKGIAYLNGDGLNIE